MGHGKRRRQSNACHRHSRCPGKTQVRFQGNKAEAQGKAELKKNSKFRSQKPEVGGFAAPLSALCLVVAPRSPSLQPFLFSLLSSPSCLLPIPFSLFPTPSVLNNLLTFSCYADNRKEVSSQC